MWAFLNKKIYRENQSCKGGAILVNLKSTYNTSSKELNSLVTYPKRVTSKEIKLRQDDETYEKDKKTQSLKMHLISSALIMNRNAVEGKKKFFDWITSVCSVLRVSSRVG